MTKRRQPGTTPSALPATKRCAVYTRKSTTAGLEQDFNSLDAQRESCEQYIRSQASLGWQLIPEPYDDGGFTGANIQRPAFQRLMQDVEAGKVDIVVVYKVDRLSRSLLDFAKLMDRFNRANVAFVSVTQNFSTADAMGRLTLNVLMSFAEFEREMIGERTRDKMAAARRKGKWTGGPPPLGYDVVDRKLVVNEAEAALVRRLFDLYLDLRSAGAVARALNTECRTTKHHVSIKGTSHGAREWDKPSVLKVLRNPIPAGLMSCHDEVHEGPSHLSPGPEPAGRRTWAAHAVGPKPRLHPGRYHPLRSLRPGVHPRVHAQGEPGVSILSMFDARQARGRRLRGRSPTRPGHRGIRRRARP
jgi:DNA invertase Pin-like site-specific DNA recombinase